MGFLGALFGGGGKDDEPAPAPVVEETPVAPNVTADPLSEGQKQRAAVASARDAAPTTGATRGGVSIVGGN